ncbi:hypothetical protein CICLE_v10010058mg [Citrus x clementina]|uniref:Uncharacterized protein n=1 Tax=Citrus clementina TaxID=85681 RepID=V4UEH8_CITCL|nr:hypothetical protein CICLE_v10010058mg [Citrus x clementina]
MHELVDTSVLVRCISTVLIKESRTKHPTKVSESSSLEITESSGEHLVIVPSLGMHQIKVISCNGRMVGSNVDQRLYTGVQCSP